MLGTTARAKILYLYATLNIRMLGKWEKGRPLLEESLETWRLLGVSYRTEYAYVLLWLGYFLYYRDQAQTGRAYLQEAVDILRESGDMWGLGWALHLFSYVNHDDGDVKTAFAMAEKGMAAFRESGDRYGVAICVDDLGRYNARQGNYLEARVYLEEALNVFREFGCKVFACVALNALGDVARTMDDYEKAEALYRESISMRQEIGAGPGWFPALYLNLAYTILGLGDDEQAVSFFAQALNLSKELVDAEIVIPCLAGLAAVAAMRGKAEMATRLYGAAEAQYHGLLAEGKTIDSLFEPVDRREFERYQGICRDQLGEAAFETAWAAGREMTLEQALAEASAIACSKIVAR